MSLQYQPENGATPDSFWGPLFLVSPFFIVENSESHGQANRDITGQAPIDKVAWPGVYVTSACFPNGVYDDIPFQTCLSNLLAVGYRRIVIDLYWDVSNKRYGLCPVEIPRASVSTSSSSSQGTAASLASSSLVSVQATSSDFSSMLLGRQVSGENSTSLSTATISTPSSTAGVPITSTTGVSGSTIITLGNYQCSQDLTLQSILGLYDDYFRSTSDAQSARFQILEFNLHAAAPSQDPNGPPRIPTAQELPTPNALVGAQFNGRLGRWVYRPAKLQADRNNLNASWFSVRSEDLLPLTEYFHIFIGSSNQVGTNDGWPNEKYLLFSDQVRLLLKWGRISSEMEGYNFGADSDAIYPRGYLDSDRPTTSSTAGVVESGCIYDASSMDVHQVNNSWATTTIRQTNIDQNLALIDNITSCGLTPMINASLSNQKFTAYETITRAGLVGWAAGEPRNVSAAGAVVNGPADKYRCALLDSSNAYRGHWRLENCQARYRAACRVENQPFKWALSTIEVPFDAAPTVCENMATTFSLPRIDLENSYLYNHVLSEANATSNDRFKPGVWINLNSLASPNCWVVTGPNGTCTYVKDQQEEHSREVLIPTIAAFLVLILSAMTLLVKCNTNRRNSRTRRTGLGGWDYEGVPS